MVKRLKGLEKVMKNLNKEIAGVVDRTDAGLSASALIVQGEAQRRVPVEYGGLRGSAFSGKHPEKKHAYRVGFTAAYAAALHEKEDMKWKGKPRKSGLGTYWSPDGEPKFLENSLLDKLEEIRSTIAAYARVGNGRKN